MTNLAAPTCIPRALCGHGLVSPQEHFITWTKLQDSNVQGHGMPVAVALGRAACTSPPPQPIPAKTPSPARTRHEDTHCVAPQPDQGAQICWSHHQLCTCRLQSPNEAVLTRTVQALILLLHTPSFSHQHPGSCSCAGAHSKYIPTPFLMGQRALHLAYPALTIRSK